MAVDRYRDRYRVSRTKSDAVDALVLANLLRTDAGRHREIPADSEQAVVVSVLARAQQDAIRERCRQTARLRSQLREFYPSALLGFPDRSEEHTSELQSPDHLVCRLLLEKKKKIKLTDLRISMNKEDPHKK